jgi:hypothetical protein
MTDVMTDWPGHATLQEQALSGPEDARLDSSEFSQCRLSPLEILENVIFLQHFRAGFHDFSIIVLLGSYCESNVEERASTTEWPKSWKEMMRSNTLL